MVLYGVTSAEITNFIKPTELCLTLLTFLINHLKPGGDNVHHKL
jgi:hypothetical protein